MSLSPTEYFLGFHWPVCTSWLFHIWFEVRSHGSADEGMKCLIWRTLTEVNESQLGVNGLVRFNNCSPLDTDHARKIMYTMYLSKSELNCSYPEKTTLYLINRSMDMHLYFLTACQTHQFGHKRCRVLLFLVTWLISRSRAVFEMVTVTQLVKKFYASYGTRRLIIMFKTAHHLIIIYSCYDKAHSSSFLEDNQCPC